jgi:hypothetical protein
LYDRVAILPQCGNTDTATAQQHNCHSRDNESVVVLFGLVHGGGHLIVHDFFSWVE